MLLPEFLQSFGTGAACAKVVRRAHWPDGFVCTRCNAADPMVAGGCRRRTSVRLSSPDLADRRFIVRQHQAAAEEMAARESQHRLSGTVRSITRVLHFGRETAQVVGACQVGRWAVLRGVNATPSGCWNPPRHPASPWHGARADRAARRFPTTRLAASSNTCLLSDEQPQHFRCLY